MTREEILQGIEQLPVLDLVALVKEMQERCGVSPAPVMAMGAMPSMAGAAAGGDGAGAAPAEPEEEQTEFNVVLTDFGAKKIDVIKVVRELVPGLGLREAKELVEGAPRNVLEGANKEAAAAAKAKLEEVGAKAEVK